MEQRIVSFLKDNGFTQFKTDETQFAGDKCDMHFGKYHPDYVIISDTSGNEFSLPDELYSIVGYLVYKKIIPVYTSAIQS